jgi:hypothetical protein
VSGLWSSGVGILFVYRLNGAVYRQSCGPGGMRKTLGKPLVCCNTHKLLRRCQRDAQVFGIETGEKEGAAFGMWLWVT